MKLQNHMRITLVSSLIALLLFSSTRQPVITEAEKQQIISSLTEISKLHQQWRDHPQMLKKKVLHLKEIYGLHPGDDLTLIRIVF